MGTPGYSPEKKAAAAERRLKAFEMRKAGASFYQIGTALDVSHAQAHRDVTTVIKDLNAKSRHLADQHRRVELERLDHMWLSIWKDAVNPRLLVIVRLPLLDRLLKIMERRAKLMGLDAPQEIKHSGDGVFPEGFLSERVRQAIITTKDGRETAFTLIERLATTTRSPDNGKPGRTGMGGGPRELGPPAPPESPESKTD